MRTIFRRIVSAAFAAIAILALSSALPKPADAAPLTSGVATSVNDAAPQAAEKVYYVRRYYARRYYRPRYRVYRPYRYYRPYYRPRYRFYY